MQIKTENLTFEYEAGTKSGVTAVDGITTEIPEGQFVGIVGHTGSGKTTFVQLLDALLKPTDGKIYFDGEDIWAKGFNRRTMRSKVGIVFQYPEHQLFEETVLKDVCFGPKNIGMSREEAEKSAREALLKVGIKEEYFHFSPFELSGGEKRRVALAGVLAMGPEVLILDEPTAGLDPGGRGEILKLLSTLHQGGMTILLVSHSMEDVAENVERILVLDKGKIVMDGSGGEVFTRVEELEEMGLAAPAITYIMRDIHSLGLPVREDITTEDEAVEEILAALAK